MTKLSNKKILILLFSHGGIPGKLTTIHLILESYGLAKDMCQQK